MNLSKVREEDNSYYVLNTGSISKWEKRLKIIWKMLCYVASCPTPGYFEKPLPGLAQSFGSVIDSLGLSRLSLQPFVETMSA